MNSAKRTVPLPEVKDLMSPGVPLPFKVLDSQGRLLLAAGQRVMDLRQLQALLERGACVEYDEVESARARRGAAAGDRAVVPSARKQTLFDHWERQTWALDSLLRQLGREPVLVPALEQFADEHIALVDKHLEAALFVCIRQDDKRFALYGLTHALHSATVAVFCARQLGWPVDKIRCLARAALTMNASMLELQSRMAEQPEPPSKRQLDIIRTHTQRSVEALQASGVTDADWLATVADHHEQPGGGGYPRGVGEVGELARVLRMADVFMAKISPRALRAPLLPQVAARQLFQAEQGGPMASALIKALGIYPPGDFVRLRSGEGAIVVRRSAASNAPVVAVLTDAAGRAVSGAPQRDTAQPAFAIVGPLGDRSGQPRIYAEQVYGLVEP